MKLKYISRLFTAMALAAASSVSAYTVVPVIDVTANTPLVWGTQLATVASQLVELQSLVSNAWAVADAATGSQLGQLSTQTQAVRVALDNINRSNQNITTAFGASQLTNFADFANNIGKRASEGNASAANLVNSARIATQQLGAANAAYSAVLSKLGNVAGVTQAAQATANSVGIVVQQQQSMLEMMSAQNQDLNLARVRQTKLDEEREKGYKAFIDRSAASLATGERALGTVRGYSPSSWRGLVSTVNGTQPQTFNQGTGLGSLIQSVSGQ